MLCCDAFLSLKRMPTGEFKGSILGQEIMFPNIVKYEHLAKPFTANTVDVEDEFIRIIQNTFLISVYNYFAVPRKSREKENQTVEIMIFMNKITRRRTRANFAKLDETMGQIASHINGFLEKYIKVYGMYEREKELKIFTYTGTEELLSCVILWIELNSIVFYG